MERRGGKWYCEMLSNTAATSPVLIYIRVWALYHYIVSYRFRGDRQVCVRWMGKCRKWGWLHQLTSVCWNVVGKTSRWCMVLYGKKTLDKKWEERECTKWFFSRGRWECSTQCWWLTKWSDGDVGQGEAFILSSTDQGLSGFWWHWNAIDW